MTDVIPPDPLGWWSIAGTELLAALRRAHSGEDPDFVYAELYANSRTDDGDDDV